MQRIEQALQAIIQLLIRGCHGKLHVDICSRTGIAALPSLNIMLLPLLFIIVMFVFCSFCCCR